MRPNGNLTSDGTNTYTWNVRNQLTALSGGTSASFQYDGQGRRRGKTISGTTTNFVYDALNLVQELTGGGTPTANLITGLGIDETFTRTDASGARSLLVDGIGSTLELTDASGTLQTHYTFEPFGATTTTGATNANAQQFTGRENDIAGLYFYRARFYSSAQQRFMSEDPLGVAGGLNLFAYASDAPTGLVDPIGLKPRSRFGPPGNGRRGSGPGGNGPGGNGPGGNGPGPNPPPPDRNNNQCSTTFFDRFSRDYLTTRQTIDALPRPVRGLPGNVIGDAAAASSGLVDFWTFARGVAAGAVNESNVIALTGAAVTGAVWTGVLANGMFEVGLEIGSALNAVPCR